MAHADDLMELVPFVRNIVGQAVPPGDVDDLTQDVLMSALCAVESFKGESLLKTWVYTLVKRSICNHYRKLGIVKRQRMIVPLAVEGSVCEAVDDRIFLEQVLSNLPEKYASVLRDRYLVGLSPKEMAVVYGIGYEGARSRYRKALQYAQRMVRDENYSFVSCL